MVEKDLREEFQRNIDYANEKNRGIATLRPAIGGVLKTTNDYGHADSSGQDHYHIDIKVTDTLSPAEATEQPDGVLTVANFHDHSDIYARIEVSHIGDADKRSYALFDGQSGELLDSGAEMGRVSGSELPQRQMPTGMAAQMVEISRGRAQQRNIRNMSPARRGIGVETTEPVEELVVS